MLRVPPFPIRAGALVQIKLDLRIRGVLVLSSLVAQVIFEFLLEVCILYELLLGVELFELRLGHHLFKKVSVRTAQVSLAFLVLLKVVTLSFSTSWRSYSL